MPSQVYKLLFLKRLYLQKMCSQCFCEPLNPSIHAHAPNTTQKLQTIGGGSLESSIATCALCARAKNTNARTSGFVAKDCKVCFITTNPLLISTMRSAQAQGAQIQSGAINVPKFLQNKSAKMLQNMIERVFLLPLQSCSILSLLKCPIELEPTSEEISACIPFLRAQLDSIKPEVIVIFGALGGKYLLGEGESERGRILWHNARRFLLTYSLNEITRNPSLKPQVLQHLLVAKGVL
ncbi:uracil-DNA glycosylase family protein [Helicobacter himalayensis]|uniref:uracil-DNA glycosylase family protein n=1 Tax=Helicobacter himalayensis TaxID=1591088 RepID=UPI003D6EF52A